MTDLTPEAAKSICDTFNTHYPVGSRVLLVKDMGEVVETEVKWPVGTSVNGPVVGLACSSGSWLLSRVIPLSNPDQERVQDNYWSRFCVAMED